MEIIHTIVIHSKPIVTGQTKFQRKPVLRVSYIGSLLVVVALRPAASSSSFTTQHILASYMTMVRYINICCVQYIILLLIVYHHPIKVSSFIPQHRLHTKITTTHHSSIISKLYASTLTSSTSTNTNIPSIKETSNELLEKLQQKTAANNRSSNDINDLNKEINNLVKILINSQSTFDPLTSINGPLFASVHFIGDTPLWEKIGARIVRNVKGQKYTLNSSTGKFSNYAEVFGTNLYLKAIGICKDEGPVTDSTVSSISTTTSSDNKLSNPLESVFVSLFNQRSISNSQYKPTPYDYIAEVTGASIVLFQKFSLDLTIEGTGIVRVLYADENLRVFLSPKDTNVTRGGGDWESAGLIVVQVRVDLIYDDWIDVL